MTHYGVDEETVWTRRNLDSYDVTVEAPGNAAGGWEIKVEVPLKENSFVGLNVYSKGKSLFAGYLASG
mgnify:CR=1 FL=1